MSSHYRQRLEEYLQRLDVKAERVLDVGGSQLPVMGRTKTWEVKEYQILDLQQPHERKAEPTFVWDLNDLLGPEAWSEAPFDQVFALEVMEYIWRPDVALENLAKLTKPGGTLHISFPHYYPAHEPLHEDCLRYTLRGAQRYLERAGFQITGMAVRESLGNGFSQLISWNRLRPSKTATQVETNSLGFIFNAVKR